jgi:HAD superfamily hydrolase (TIGR01450 family)
VGADLAGEADAEAGRAAPAPGADAFKGFLVDLDGTLLHGSEPIPGARAFLVRHGARSVVVSNNSAETPAMLAGRLAALGLAVDHRRIVLAGTLTIDTVAAQHPRARALLLGSPALADYAVRVGLTLTSDQAEIVIVARDERFDYVTLAHAANLVRDGARFYATNPDVAHPGEGGRIVPETGALLAALAAAAGRPADAVFGKPGPMIFAAALARLGTAAAETAMIGDNPETDGAGARRLGLSYLEVGARAGRTIAALVD